MGADDGERSGKGGRETDLNTFLERGLAGEDMGWSRSGRMIASHLRDNWDRLPYETGASLAAALGLSEMTVIRFIRQLGYANLKDFKEALKPTAGAEAASMGNVFKRLQLDPLEERTLEKSLKRELEAVTEAYKLTTLPRWRHCVETIADPQFVSVVGFQASRGLAIDFSSRLQYVRPKVRFSEDHAGVFAEILDMSGESHCLVLVDTHSYARKGVLLAEKARDAGMPLVIVTDKFSNWAYEYTDLVLQGETFVETFWDSSASLTVILNLLIDSIAQRHSKTVQSRTERMRERGQHFGEFDQRTSQHRASPGRN
ncbi:MurR/RpiR family transcriptional regulator [Shinella sp. S4-D37]|uniref:MurR/RpiR family transcriptional regulator n=1 Tax=Shinella sp. S4-D37 TaxID=3161999 RepID=UPI00346727FE